MIRVGTLGAPSAHLDDGALVRRLDGELEPAEATAVEAHLAACDRCRAELDALAALSTRFSDALPLVDAPVLPLPRSRPASPWHAAPIWRAAAAVAFVAGLALAITPVRAWIAERLGLSAERPVETAAPAGPTEPATASGVRVTFIPTGERFRVLLTAPQRSGALRLETTPGDTASGEILGPDDADLLVLPDGLGIRNTAFSTTDYRVVVPRDVAEIEVRVAGRIAWLGSPAEVPGGGSRIDLTNDDDR